jgi:hypothetical protein
MARFGYFVCACMDSIYRKSREFVKGLHGKNLRCGWETPTHRELQETRSLAELELTATRLAKLHFSGREVRGVECQRRLLFAL